MQINGSQEIATDTLECFIIVAQHLISATDAQERLVSLNGFNDLFILAVLQVRQQSFLFEVLSATDEEQIKVLQVDIRSDRHLCHLTADTTPFQAFLQADDIAPVTIQIQDIRI